MATEVFYNILNRRTSAIKPLSVRVNEVIGQYINAGRRDEIGNIPAVEFMAPESIDYTHGNYVVMDGVYHSYLLVPAMATARRYVQAGFPFSQCREGIDVDVFFHRQPKDRIQQSSDSSFVSIVPKSRILPIPTLILMIWTVPSVPATFKGRAGCQ